MSKLTLSNLDRELRNKKLRPVYLIYGPEQYLVNTAVGRIKDYCYSVVQSPSPNPLPSRERVVETPPHPPEAGQPRAEAAGNHQVERFSAKETRPAQIMESAQTHPMWVQHKLIVVDDAEGFKNVEEFLRYIEKPSPTSTLVFIAKKMDARTKFVQAILEKGGVLECKSLYERETPDWIRLEATSKGKAISLETAKFLSEVVGNNLGSLAQAIEKLVLYIGNKQIIEVSDVEKVLTETSQRSIFDFTNAVGKRDLRNAIHALSKLLQFGESEVMILSMLARHFRLLTKAKEALARRADENELASALKVHPFFVKDYVAQSKLFAMDELIRDFQKLYQTDRELKSSKLPKKMVLERCVRELVAVSGKR